MFCLSRLYVLLDYIFPAGINLRFLFICVILVLQCIKSVILILFLHTFIVFTLFWSLKSVTVAQ